VHGANRLASNSLLEGMVFAFRVVEAIEQGKVEAEATGAMRAVLDGDGSPGVIRGRPVDEPSFDVDAGDATEVFEPAGLTRLRDRLQRRMTELAGVIRTGSSLQAAMKEATAAAGAVSRPAGSPAAAELRNLARLAHAMSFAALVREESRGAHTRQDFPERDDQRFRSRLVLRPPVSQAGAA
jgi:L-aspartate oxidase